MKETVVGSSKDAVDTAVSSESSGNDPKETEAMPMTADVAFLTALRTPEYEQVLQTFGSDWQREGREGVIFSRINWPTDHGVLSLVAACQSEMGMVPAAILSTKTARAWTPRLIVLVGICAGVKERVNVGDIVVGRQLFDYGSGKIMRGRLLPDFQPVTLDDQLCACAVDLAQDREVLREIRDSWPLETGKPATELKAHVEAMASGAAVVADESIVEGIQENKRSLAAVDMEAYGVARASMASLPRSLSLIIKGVQDHADEFKSDEYREYAAFVSARFATEFVRRYWGQIGSA